MGFPAHERAPRPLRCAPHPEQPFPAALHPHPPAPTLREVLIAIEGWIATAKAHGKRIPKPRYRPAIYAAAS
jgi:hypothetical protein